MRIEIYTTVVQAVPAMPNFATPYASGDNIGGLLTLAPEATLPRLSGKIVSLRLTDKAKQDAPIDVVFFVGGLPGSTFTDNTAQTITDADLLNTFAVKILAANYSDFVDNSVATVANIQCRFKLTNDNQILYAALVSRGTPTYASTADLLLEVAIEQDS